MIGYRKKINKVFEGIDLSNFDKEAYIKKFDEVVVPGIYVLVAIYKDIIKDKIGSLYLPDSALDEEEEFSSTVGLFIKCGTEAYEGNQFPSGPYARPGDWVQFNRASCTQGVYDGMPYIITEDHKIRLVIDDPSKIGR